MKRNTKDAGEELYRPADEEASRLREVMLTAAADDDQSNKKSTCYGKGKVLPSSA